MAAIFTHFEGARRDPGIDEGATLVLQTEEHKSWFWYIPLPDDRVSVGVVGPIRHLIQGRQGDPQRVFEEELARCPGLVPRIADARQTMDVQVLNDFSCSADRAAGDGWVLVGDAFGFIDPVFSSGLLIALDGAWELAQALHDGSEKALRRFEARNLRQLASWQRVVSYFYDGRLFTLFKIGDRVGERWYGRLLNLHFRKHMPRVVTGEATIHPYSMGLVDFMVKYGLMDEDPRGRAVR
jgi:flavin-dependent dehydrogenase